MEEKYADIIDCRRPVHDGDAFSRVHPRMSLINRAKIFSPFAALQGFEEAVAAKEVQYVPKRILDADEEYELNRRLNILCQKCRNGRMVRESPVRVDVLYYVPCADKHSDAYGRGGLYSVASGTVQSIDVPGQCLTVGDKRIRFDDIADISGDEL